MRKDNKRDKWVKASNDGVEGHNIRLHGITEGGDGPHNEDEQTAIGLPWASSRSPRCYNGSLHATMAPQAQGSSGDHWQRQGEKQYIRYTLEKYIGAGEGQKK